MAKFLVPTLFLAALSPSALGQDACPVPGLQVNREVFLSPLYTASIAWLQNGEDSNEHFVLGGGCSSIFVERDVTTLFFDINNYTASYSADDAFSFAGVQIIRVQQQRQAALDILIQRNDEWERDGAVQGGFRNKPVRNMRATDFFELNAKDPFDDAQLKYGKIWWHATPRGGSVASNESPTLWIPEVDLSPFGERILISNRLYRYQRNKDGNQGIGFDIGIDGTELIHIRYHSPGWADPNYVYSREIRIKRQ